MIINKKILVCGMARSGISAALLLSTSNDVTIQDLKQQDKFQTKDIELLKKNKIKVLFGKNPDDIISNFDLVILSPGIPTHLPFLQKAKKIIGEIELGYMYSDSKIIAITGTNGKTTTTSIVGDILTKHNKNTKILGNIGKSFTSEVCNLKKDSYAVLELSSFQLETTEMFKPFVSAVLNISEDHLDVHKTMKNYITCKEKIFKNQDKENYLVLNYDDNYCKSMANKTDAQTIFFSLDHVLDEGLYYKDDYIYINLFGIKEKFLNINDLKLLGMHNVYNLMASIAICLCCKVDKELIKKCLIDFKAVEHRLEYVTTINNIDFYNDSKATNTDAAIKSIEAIKKPIILIAGGYDKNADFTSLVNMFDKKVKHVIVLGAVKEKLKKVLDEQDFLDYTLVDSFLDGVLKAYEKASDGDCVLLAPACASFDSFDNFEQRGDVFKEIVKNFEL